MNKSTKASSFPVRFCVLFAPCLLLTGAAKTLANEYGTDHYVPAEITTDYPRPQYAFPHARSYSVTFRTDVAALKDILPDRFRPVPGFEDYVFLGVNQFKAPNKNIGLYNEAYIGVPAILKGKDGDITGSYTVQLYLGSVNPESSVSPTMAGNIIYGIPKREGEFHVYGDFLTEPHVTLGRHGKKLWDIEFEKKEAAPRSGVKMPPEGMGMLLKAIPRVDGKGWDVLQVTAGNYRNEELTCIPYKVHETKAFDVKFNGGQVALDSGRVIPVKEVLYTEYNDIDWCMDWSVTLYDYLED